MRLREKLTLEEKVSLALELIKRERTLEEIRAHYRVSHTTAYKVRNAFLAGGRAALMGNRHSRGAEDLERRVRTLETLMQVDVRGRGRPAQPARREREKGGDGQELVRKG